MKTNFKKVFTSLILAMTLVVTSAMPAFAAEPATNEINRVANSVTYLYAGQHITLFGDGTLTFTDKRTVGDYYVEGRWLDIALNFRTADGDRGEGGIWLTVEVLDASTNAVLGSQKDYVPVKGASAGTNFTFDLRNFGRTVKLRFDASSYGQSNGNFRSATLTGVTAYAFG